MPRFSKVALVTGSSGGIGAACARLLAENNWRVALHYNQNKVGARKTLAEVISAGSKGALFQGDLARASVANSLIRKVVRRFGNLDLLVNNAGAVLGQSKFSELGSSEFHRTLHLNLVAPFILARDAFAAMERRGGRIISISSIGAKFGGSTRSMHYSAAKAGLECVTLGLAREGASKGILVNAIRGGVIDTPFHKKFPKDLKKRMRTIPVGRLGMPEDVARMVVHLAGPGGDFVTGQIIHVTGGE